MNNPTDEESLRIQAFAKNSLIALEEHAQVDQFSHLQRLAANSKPKVVSQDWIEAK